MKRFIALLMIVSMCAALIIPASASCDDCIEWEYNLYADNPDHCSIHCTGDSRDTCGSCGDGYTLELCTATHDYDTKIQTTPGTSCTDYGTEIWQCDCGKTVTWPGSTAGDHSWDSGTIDEAAGKIHYTCTVCGDTYAQDYNSTHKHDYATKILTNPGTNCMDGGTEVWQCSCGDTTVVLGSTYGNHDWNDGEIDSAAGKIYYTCTICGESKADSYTPGHTHNFIKTVTKPTCTYQGFTTYRCSCGYSYVGDYVDQLQHNYVATVKAPTCSSPGYTAHVCSYCQDSYITDEKPITDHVWVNYGSPTGPKCSTEGCLVQFETNFDAAYQKLVPDDARFATIGVIGGMTRKCANLLPLKDYSRTVNGVAVSISKGIVTVSGTADTSGGRTSSLCDVFMLKAGTYTFSCTNEISALSIYLNEFSGNTVLVGASKNGNSITLEEDTNVFFGLNFEAGATYNASFSVMLYKGTEPLPYEPYFEGLRSAPVTEVECDGSKLPIPAEVQALDGYGWGIDNTVYNYIDLDKKQFVKRVGKVVFDGTENWQKNVSHANTVYLDGVGNKAGSLLLCSYYDNHLLSNLSGVDIGCAAGSSINIKDPVHAADVATWKSYVAELYATGKPVTMLYELAEPIITDISDLLPADNLIGVEAGGTVTMVNEYGYDVPSTITYYEDPVDCSNGHFYDSSEKCYLCGTAKAKRYQPVACSTCGETSMNPLPDLEHDFTIRLVASTCSSPGYTAHTCEICGITYADNYTAQLAHNWGSRTEDAVAGKVYYACTLCGEIKVVDFDTDHDHVYTSTVVPATCTTRGYTLHQCSCGHSYYSNWVNVPGHKYAAVVIAPTCEKPGFTIHTCTVCGQSFKDNFTDPEPHLWDVTTSKSTCTTPGHTTRICSICSYSEVVSSELPLGHTIINGVCTKCQYSSSCVHTYKEIVVEPTCHDQGYTLYSCTKCGDGTYGDYKAALSHVWLKSGSVQARCDKDGYTEYTCSLCGDPRYDTIPALGHKWTALGAQVNEDNTSVVTYGCDVCMIRKTETIQTAASQAQNWLLTSIRGFSGAIIDMFNTVTDGVQIGGVTVKEVISGCLVLVIVFCFFGFIGNKLKK